MLLVAAAAVVVLMCKASGVRGEVDGVCAGGVHVSILRPMPGEYVEDDAPDLQFSVSLANGDAVPGGRATTPFVYMLPMEAQGDEFEWQLSWVRTVEAKERLEILKEAFSRIALKHLEEVEALQAHIHSLQESINHK
eukprot:Tamp_40350.p2 GENE.Tamp_40350~~Tamp_40350.p2  ORF type:complete len:144 (-),score=25.63 Tamp_40350:24-434(-)